MRKKLLTLSLIGTLTGLTVSTRAQTNVWHDDFDQYPVGYGAGPNFTGPGTYGRIAFDFSNVGAGNPMVVITNGTNPDTLPGDPSYTHSNYCAFIFTSTNVFPPAFNFGWDINSIAANGNTNTDPRAYILKFDFAVQGDGLANLGGFIGPEVYLFSQNAPGTYSSGEYYGNGTQDASITPSFFPAPGAGWQHVEMPLSGANWGTAHAGAINFLAPAFSFGFGAYMNGLNNTNQQEIDIANVELTEVTPPILNPTNYIISAKPGLRLFAQNNQKTYNQEGFGTVDINQSWVGVATPANPVSYSITIGDFNTAPNYALYVQFVQNGNPGDPFGVYNGQNALVWTIQNSAGGFTTSVNWKTNAPASGQNNVAMPVTTTTSTNGVGTWTLTFTDDLDGTVTAPDGTTGTVTLPDEAAAADFANSCIIDFGTAPNNTAGYGQWITFNKIAISNVIDGTEVDDFTQDTNLNTTLWNPGFSLDANSVVQVPPGKSYWVKWTTPANGFGLETKAQLIGGTNMWFSPNYYGNGVGASNSPPKLMGNDFFWTLVPGACFPTTDGTINGPVSPTAFFRLANPPPTQ